MPRDNIDDIWYEHLLTMELDEPCLILGNAMSRIIDGLVFRGFSMRVVMFLIRCAF